LYSVRDNLLKHQALLKLHHLSYIPPPEYYAIFVPDDMIEDVEIDAPYYKWGKTDRGVEYHVYGFGDYQSYDYALANM